MSIPQSGGGPIEHPEQMAAYLAAGCKPESKWRIGTEHEKFGFCQANQSLCPIPGPVQSRPSSKRCATASGGRQFWKRIN